MRETRCERTHRLRRLVWILAFCAAIPGGAAEASDADPFEPTITRREAELMRQAYDLAQEDLSAAIAFFRENDMENASPAVDFALGNFYYQGGKLKDAEVAYRRAIRKLPRYRDALNNLGRVYLTQDEPRRAMEVFQGLLRDGQADADMLMLLGHSLLLQQQPVSAEGAYRQSLVLAPGQPEAMRGLIKCLIEQGRYREAVALTTELLHRRTGDVELWSLRANANLALDELDEAVTCIETARRLGAASPALVATLGDLYLNRGQPRDAANAYKEAFAGETPSIDRMLRAARAFFHQDALEEAEVMLQRIRRTEADGSLSPSQRRGHLRLEARFAARQGNAEEAMKAYASLIRDDPLDAEAMLALAELRAESDHTEEARMLYERAARIAGFEVPALVRHAQLEVEQDRFQTAMELLEAAQAFEEQPHIARYLDQVRRLASP